MRRSFSNDKAQSFLSHRSRARDLTSLLWVCRPARRRHGRPQQACSSRSAT